MLTTTGRTRHITWYRTDAAAQILFLHGFSDSAECWDPVVRAIGDRWGMVALDARGHGESELPTEPAGRVAQARDAAMVLDEVAAGPVVVVGHSMGAGTAMQLAQLRPELVRGLVLEDPVLPPPGQVNQRGSGPLPEWLQRLRALDLEERIALGRKESPTWPEDELGPWARSKAQLHEDFTSLRPASDGPPYDLLAGLGCPTLVVAGDVAHGSVVAEKADGVPVTRFVRIAGVGHSVRREARDRFLVELAAFVAAATSDT